MIDHQSQSFKERFHCCSRGRALRFVCRGIRLSCLTLLLAAVASSAACAADSTGKAAQLALADQATTAQEKDMDSKTSAARQQQSAKTRPEASTSEEAEENAAEEQNRVLRHAVFFSFNDSSTEEDIQEVVNAFRALPSKIDAIEDFEWGVNNSPEGLDDGFTHCFLLTFKNKQGRAEYLPHPAHKAFGDVLRPHRKDVFVFDYWGRADLPEVKTPLRHAVFFKFKDDAAPEQVKAVEEAFAALPSKIDAIKAFEWGRNNSPESHDDGFTHCFMVTFDTVENRATYLPHPDHKAFVKLLRPVLDKVRVLDFFSHEP